MRQKTICGAHARTTGQPCQAKALANGRCNLHGGKSTGPKTAKGRERIRAAQIARWQRVATPDRPAIWGMSDYGFLPLWVFGVCYVCFFVAAGPSVVLGGRGECGGKSRGVLGLHLQF